MPTNLAIDDDQFKKREGWVTPAPGRKRSLQHSMSPSNASENKTFRRCSERLNVTKNATAKLLARRGAVESLVDTSV